MGRRTAFLSQPALARRNAGAARVGALWLVIVGVLFLGAATFGFMAQSETTKEHEARVAAETAAKEAADQTATAQKARRDTAALLGWYDRNNASEADTNLEVAKKALEDLKGTFTDLGAGDTDFELAMQKIVAAFNDRAQKIAELETRIQTLQSEIQTANESTTNVEKQKDEVINGLRQQVADEQKNAQQRETELESRLEAMRTQLGERDSELRQVREEAQLASRAFGEKERVLMARNSELSEKTKFATSPFANEPDGKVLEVSDRLQLGWVDRGANQRMSRGMRFRIESGKPNNRRFKAWGEVTRVEQNRSEIAFSDLADRFDPVVPGDVIINPLYDPVGGRNAVLIGRFSGAYNEKELAALLDRMGVHVQPAIDITTHFLIVGSEIWNDPETNEPLEEPIQPSDLPAYKMAEAQSIQIVPLQDIREFFRAGVE